MRGTNSTIRQSSEILTHDRSGGSEERDKEGGELHLGFGIYLERWFAWSG
jgi:hypothetical protein